MNLARHLAIILLLAFGITTFAQDFKDFQEFEEIPAARQSLLKTAATRDYDKPLFFDQVDRGVVLPPLELEYDLTGAQGKILRMGPITVSEANFSFALMPLGKTHPQLPSVLSGGEAQQLALIVALPEYLIESGTIEMISRTGSVLWAKKFTADDLRAWETRLEGWKKKLIAQGVRAKQINNVGVFASRFALLDVKKSDVPFWNVKDSFRFCVSQEEGRSSSRLCSQRYGIDRAQDPIKISRVRVDKISPRVLIKNEAVPLKQDLKVSLESPTSFFAELESGISYEFVSLPHRFELMDIADTEKPDVLRIVGYDVRPLGRSIILNPDQYTGLTRVLGFEATIGDSRKFWASALKKDSPAVYFPGPGGGVFKQRFVLSEIPQASSRIYLHRRTPTGTYSDGIKLFGRKQPTSRVNSTENSVQTSAQADTDLTWRFKATQRGLLNKSYLNVEFEGKTYHSYFELYKGYPRELSGRFSGVQTASGFVAMGEVAYNHWFEDILGWSNYWVSRQRWGVSAKYFKSFNELKVSTAGDTAPLDSMILDLKYRLTPGLWNRDATLGALVSYQDVKFGDLKAPMLGVGGFWARSMPKVLDDVFNIFSIFQYPKWVDVEFIYYASSMDSSVELNAPMSLNFHGKVIWTDNFFGEAGFGMKRYSFQNKALNQKAELNTFYGTVGVGLSF